MISRAPATSSNGEIDAMASGPGRPTLTIRPPTAVMRTAASNARAAPAHSITTSATKPAEAASSEVSAESAPSSRASSTLSELESTPTTVTPGSERATSSAAIPTPPSPTIAIVCPGFGRPALSTAPPPVRTAQPSTAAMSAGTSRPTATSDRASSTACVANPDTPRWCATLPCAP